MSQEQNGNLENKIQKMLRKEYKKQLSDLDLKIYSKIKTKISTLIDIVS